MDIHCSSIDGRLGFYFLAIMNNAVMNIHYQFCVEDVFISLETISRSGIAESYGNSV